MNTKAINLLLGFVLVVLFNRTLAQSTITESLSTLPLNSISIEKSVVHEMNILSTDEEISITPKEQPSTTIFRQEGSETISYNLSLEDYKKVNILFEEMLLLAASINKSDLSAEDRKMKEEKLNALGNLYHSEVNQAISNLKIK